MKEIIISEAEAGQRLDKTLSKLLGNAGKGFLYKMLRKKNIKLNNKKAEGNEKLTAGDSIQLYFSDETYAALASENRRGRTEDLPPYTLDIIYEDDHIILINKPAGMLSQKAKEGDVSINDYLIRHVRKKGLEGRTVKPSICNRLDRNTSGLIIGGCSIAGLQGVAELLHEKKIRKYYCYSIR